MKTILLDSKTMLPSYIPDKVLNREKELNELEVCLKNSVNIFVHGPLGLGKTLIIRKVIQDFRISDYSINHPLEFS